MKELGFGYRYKKKSYYVDRHEDENVIHYRQQYIKDHFNTELTEQCWVRMLQQQCENEHEKVKIKLEKRKMQML